MNHIAIKYTFTWPNQQQTGYEVTLDAKTLSMTRMPAASPDWTRLDFQQCPHCPLDSNTIPSCPLARQFTDLIAIFSKATSHEKLKVEVITEERNVYKETTVQRAISSLLGLIIPTTGCPHT